MTALLSAHDVSLTYRWNGRRTIALAPISLTVAAGERVALVGRSGAGKTTLADLVLGLKRPATGSITIGGEPWSDPGRTPHRRRRREVQGVPQDAGASFPPHAAVGHQLRRALRLLDPAADAASRISEAARRAAIDPLLLDRRPSELSGGQAQRAAIARALVVRPSLLVADEPTSALDPTTGAAIGESLLELPRSTGASLLLVTHDPALAERCDRVIEVRRPEGEE